MPVRLRRFPARFSARCSVLLCFLAAQACAAPVKPLRLILVGDSTMASSTGYGDALCARFTPETACHNLARGGRSSASFRLEGRWDEVRALLREDGVFAASYVLIQFGHNDQPGKPGRSTDYASEFPANMRRYVDEARALGARPVLVTPLARRSFRGPWLHDDLAPWAATLRAVARDAQAPLLDLHARSLAQLERMGPRAADAWARSGANVDQTHLGPAGAEQVAALVAHELARRLPALRSALRDAP